MAMTWEPRPTGVPRARWADVVDSSQEQEDASQQEVRASQLLHQDSYQDSQASQQASQSGICDLLRNNANLAEAGASQDDRMPDTEVASSSTDRPGFLSRRRHMTEASVSEAMGTVAEEPEVSPVRKERRPLSSVLTEAASSLTPAPKAQERKRGGTAQSSPATKRHRPRGRNSVPREEEQGAAQQNQAQLSEEDWAQRQNKRRTVISSHKRRPDYIAYNSACPRGSRDPEEPNTPDPDARTSKRQWESEVQHWRKSIREWNGVNGINDEEILDDISESPNYQ